ncbi:MAG: bifunctional phosphopantothenoylcysteine decarboxylase/phosphopantothenate--cysteine ligase CoaBC [Sphingomonadales bacterium]
MLKERSILLIIGGGIAAYKSLELIRRLRGAGARVRCILTRGGSQFVTPLSVAGLSGEQVFEDLFSLKDETEMGHIRLSREADVVVVAPATANLMARMASGIADDLASTTLLATDKPVFLCPSMNVEMWQKPSTRRNARQLEADGNILIGPGVGELACGEEGAGRMAEVEEIMAALTAFFGDPKGLLAGRRALVTAGPTYEPIDPVRYLGNRSSGKQGYAVAAALADLGAETVLVSGPTSLKPPSGVEFHAVETADEMLEASLDALPVDVAVAVAAVSDWRVKDRAEEKIKKSEGGAPKLELVENPDILAKLSEPGNRRPRLVIGFAAETRSIVPLAREKLERKGCDWIVANDVSEAGGAMGGDENQVHLITAEGVETWERAEKSAVARRLARRIAENLAAEA